MQNDYTSLWTAEEWREHSYVYCYTVYWKEQCNLVSTMWYQKPFASKKEAKAFAKKKRDKSVKLKPYIIRTIVGGNYFKKDIKVEYAHGSLYDVAEVIKV